MACWTWVAYDGPRPAGFTILDGVDPQTGLWTQPAGTNDRQIGSGPEEKVVALEHLWIDTSDHGLGLGRSLFEVLHRQAEQTGADWLEVYSDPNADGFYRRMGFEPHSEFRSTVCGEDRCLPILRMRLG